ncbi:MAG: PEGA domain-containing protein [Calditrichaeota bacterium]|nr:MAG: PEGA domain-containing protein [Calditrichota bacterium]
MISNFLKYFFRLTLCLFSLKPNNILIGLVCFFAFNSTLSAQNSSDRIAVLGISFVDVTEIDSAETINRIKQNLLITKKISLLPTQNINSFLAEKPFYQNCFEKRCLKEICENIDAEKLIWFELTQIGENYFSCEANIYSLKDDFTSREIEDCFDCNWNVFKSESLLNLAYKVAGLQISDESESEETGLVGKVEITSKPSGARIYLNGEVTNKITPTTLQLTSGRYKVTVVTDKLSSTKFVEAELGKTKTENFELQKGKSNIQINSNPTEAEVSLNGRTIGYTPSFIAGLDTGLVQIGIKKDGYQTISQKLLVLKSTNQIINFNLEYSEAETLSNDILALPTQGNFASIYVTSIPSDARIYIDGQITNKKTPALINKIPLGKYQLRVVSEEKSAIQYLDLTTPQKQDIQMILNDGASSLEVLSSPDEAEVSLDGKIMGYTPLFIPDLQKGKYLLKVFKKNYIEHKEQIDLDRSKNPILNINFQNYASLDFSGNDFEGVEIFLNGEQVGPFSRHIKKIPPQTVELKVLKDGIVQQRMTMNLGSGEKRKIKFNFDSEESLLKLTSNIPNTIYFMEGHQIFPPTKLERGTYKVTAKTFGHFDQDKEVKVEFSGMNEFKFEMIPTPEYLASQLETSETYKVRAFRGMVFTSSFLAVSGGLAYLANKSYNDYKKSRSSSKSESLYSKTKNLDLGALITFTFAVAGGIYTGYSTAKYFELKSQKRPSLTLKNENELTKIGIEIQF